MYLSSDARKYLCQCTFQEASSVQHVSISGSTTYADQNFGGGGGASAYVSMYACTYILRAWEEAGTYVC